MTQYDCLSFANTQIIQNNDKPCAKNRQIQWRDGFFPLHLKEMGFNPPPPRLMTTFMNGPLRCFHQTSTTGWQ